MEGYAQHVDHTFIYDGYFPIQTEISLVRGDYIANTITYISPMYHYIMLVICCSKLLLEVYKKRASKGSRPIASSEHTICFARKKMTDNKLAIGKGDVFIVSYRAIHS